MTLFFSKRYATAFLAVTVALLVRLGLDPVVGDDVPFVTFYLAVCWSPGPAARPALVAVILSILAADFFFLPPRYDFGIYLLHHQIETAGFLNVGIGIGLICEVMRQRAGSNSSV